MRPTRSALLACLAVACHRPDPAPEELDDLCAYLYDHADDEDEALATEGLENLRSWLEDGLDQLSEGYTVDHLYQSTLDELGEQDRDAGAIAGAAVASTADGLEVEAVVDTLVLADQSDVYADTYSAYDREYDGDPACFVARDCDWLEMDNSSVASLPLSIEIATDMHAQERWIDLEAGPALLHRAWLVEPSTGGILDVEAQYHLAATMPWDGGVVRVQAMWADAELIGVEMPEGSLLNMLVNNLVTADATLYAYTEDHE